MKKSILIVLLIGVLSVFYINNFYIVLKIAGFSMQDTFIIEETNHDANFEYSVILTSKNDEPVLAYLQKNNFEIWTIEYLKYKTEDDIIQLRWTTFHDDYPRMRTHYMLYGENAIQPIDISLINIPEGLQVEVIFQENNRYLLRISYGFDENLDVFHQFVYEDLLISLSSNKIIN